MQQKEYLVEIRFKDWVVLPDKQSRVFTYIEVLAKDDYYARHAAFDEFRKQVQYSPIMRRKFEQQGLPITDYCAPDCVEI